MSPPHDDSPQTPESKSTSSGLAGVLKNLAVGRLKTSTSSTPSAAGSLSRTLSKAAGGTLAESGHSIRVYGGPPDFEQYLKRLQPLQPLSERIAAAESTRYVIEDYSLTNVMGIWSAAKDLTDDSNPAEARKSGFDLLTACAKHSDLTPLERRQFFESISSPCHREDFHLQLNALVELTIHGKNLESFETVVVPLLTKWLNDWFEASSAARKGKASKVKGSLGEETNLGQLFKFITEVVRFNFKAFREQDVVALLTQVLLICKRTTVEVDIRNALCVMDAVITYGDVPEAVLQTTVEILCGVYASLQKNLAKLTWNAIGNILRSHLGQKTLQVLLDILRPRSGHGEQNMNSIRGSAAVFKKLFKANGANGLPLVPFASLMDALTVCVKKDCASMSAQRARDDARLSAEVLEALASLFESQELPDFMLDEEWDQLFSIICQCAERVDVADNLLSTNLSRTIIQIISDLERIARGIDPVHRKSVMDFFMRMHKYLPRTSTEQLIDYYAEEQLCYPSNEEWLHNSKQLIEVLFMDHSQLSSIRAKVLKIVKDVYRTIIEICQPEVSQGFLMPIVDIISSEEDDAILEALVDFAVSVADEADTYLFDVILGVLGNRLMKKELISTASPSGTGSLASPVLESSRPNSSTASAQPTNSLANIVTKGLVRIFLRSINSPSTKAPKVFNELLAVVKSGDIESDARLSAMKLLFRLRSDANHAINVISSSESEGLAASLCRTVESASNQTTVEDVPHPRIEDAGTPRSSRSTSSAQPQPYMSRSRSTRSISGPNRISKPSPPLWMYPGPKALPEDPPITASEYLYSFAEQSSETASELRANARIALKLNIWIEIIVSTLQQGGDWEVYSYMLIHLGTQLTNHSLFAGAIPQLKLLRNVLCEQIRANSFHEPPINSGLKKADVALCLFQVLTMLLSYHEYFAKSEEDEIVRTFLLGIGSWDRTSTSCIHALSICCHELPLSISKSLNTILQKMSSIITQSHVAVHILEFLACLARMPNVYVNFREDDYRTVFGVCFRYLQYVRDQRQRSSAPPSARTSVTSGRYSGTSKEFLPLTELSTTPKTSDDLPQYVFALAYHVITFWFMSLRLDDRVKYVSWITKNLISTDAAGKEWIEEQSQVTIDMMQRVAYADRDETEPETDFASAADGTPMKKSWLVGLSILTIETAGASGKSQITKRQPSGTTHALVQQLYGKSPSHQIPLPSGLQSDGKDAASRLAVLPSHIFLQFFSSSNKVPEALQPIVLPDDDATKRAIGTFDRNSTVDGHKVGIIYIGEGQTKEREILANVMGSADYTEFLAGLGTLIRLKGATFNTQGLDRESDGDGEFAFGWRDRVTEMVFHITTMMPTNLDHDPQCSNKKRHTGNDFVNIIFNNSGLPFKFDTFPSDFNYVNIVITPESRASFVDTRLHFHQELEKRFYKVQVMSKPGFPEISPAAETKIVSGKSLPSFVRLLALNASVFSLVWANREGGEYVSSWRNRLREIVKLREKHSSTAKSPITKAEPGGSSVTGVAQHVLSSQHESKDGIANRRTSAATFLSNNASHRSSVLSTTTELDVGGSQDSESIADSFDFSKWV
ncbi:MAG: Tuberous sclerosis 2-like protein [Candelina mexicana]|nr:MAG: Tuberous sclerosis 2-like protein [Candelina mexicana]